MDKGNHSFLYDHEKHLGTPCFNLKWIRLNGVFGMVIIDKARKR